MLLTFNLERLGPQTNKNIALLFSKLLNQHFFDFKQVFQKQEVEMIINLARRVSKLPLFCFLRRQILSPHVVVAWRRGTQVVFAEPHEQIACIIHFPRFLSRDLHFRYLLSCNLFTNHLYLLQVNLQLSFVYCNLYFKLFTLIAIYFLCFGYFYLQTIYC